MIIQSPTMTRTLVTHNRILTAALFVFLTGVAMAQSSYPVKISWLSPKMALVKGHEQQVMNIENGFYPFDFNGLPCVSLTPSFAEVELEAAKYIAVTKEELALIDTTVVGSQPIVTALHGTKYKKPIVNTYVLPFRKNELTGKFEKLISFTFKNKSKTSTITKRFLREAATGTAEATKSVLAEGDWYKLSISGSTNATGSGMHKLDYKFLASIGFPVNTVDPRKIKLYGNGLGMLPLANATKRPDDLVENPILVVGQEDGKFDATDYILFYAKGPHAWNYKTSSNEFIHEKNLYSEAAFYFLTHSPDQSGLRITPAVNNFSGGVEVNSSPAHEFWESDDVNMLQSGNKWYSNPIDNPLVINFNTRGIISSKPLTFVSSVMAQGKVETQFSYGILGQNFTQSLGETPAGDYGDKGKQSEKFFTINNANGPTLDVTISYNKIGNSLNKGYLDYFEVHYEKQIGLYGNQSTFNLIKLDNKYIQKVVLNTASNAASVWEITAPGSYKLISTVFEGSNLVFNDSINTYKEYVIFSGNNFSPPIFVGKVANQDLHGITNGKLPDMVLITVPSFLQAANELKSFRKLYNNLDVEVVTTEQIYNEFSSGKQDLTAIKDFLKMLYNRSDESDSTGYVLLFGACSYDYKDRITGNTNIVPIFESFESLHNVDSYCSDDYIASLDNIEGDSWGRIGNFLNTVDMGVGRLPARTPEEAMALVQKIKDYHTHPASLGKWRNRASFVADDTTPKEVIGSNQHATNSETASNVLESLDKNLNLSKFYVDSYQQISTPGGEISPDIKAALLNNINKGTLMVNYSGHGSESIWAQADIINIDDINALKNRYSLPFFITATCVFGRYDDPNKFSGGMSLSLNPIGGAIGLLTSTRPVYADSNTDLNSAFFKAMFPASTKSRIYPTMGQIMAETKNDSRVNRVENTRNFALLCDPSLTLAFPKQEVTMTSINGRPFNSELKDTLKALSVVTVKGEIKDNGVSQKNFNGTVNLSLYDKVNIVSTIGAFPNKVMQFKVRNSLIYDGSVAVDSGKFTFQFVIPKDINYTVGSSKFSFYAQSSDGNHDAGNPDTSVMLGSSAQNIALDNTPPTIKLFMDDTTFINGGMTNTDTRLIAKLFDENGINISSSGIGHEITGLLSSDKKVVVMNEFYTTINNSYKSGKVEYPFSKLEPGNYSLQFKAWDTYNNSSTSSIEFTVGEKFALQQVMNFPNPFITKTNFSFGHNRAGEELEVNIQITDEKGVLVKTISKTIYSSPNTVSDIDWMGDGDSGQRLSSGVYIYKIRVTSPKDKVNASETLRMVLIN